MAKTSTKTAPKKTVKTKAAAGSKVPGKKVAGKTAATKKTPAKKAEGTPRGDSIRLRVFKALKGFSGMDGLTGGEIKTKLGLTGIPSLLKDEGVCEKPRIKRLSIEGKRGVVYQLTAAGKKAVEAGTVDSEAAPPSFGTPWS